MNTFPVPADEPIGSQGPLAGAGPEGAGAGSACPAPAPIPAVAERSEAEPQGLNAIPVRAMEDVMHARAEQILRYGHTPEADMAQPLTFFAEQIADRARAILEHAHCHGPHAVLRRRAVKLAATALALIDRIDGAPSAQSRESQDHG